MSEPQAPPFWPADFGGIVRVFPLPNLVVFPHILQALHVFEPRYRQLLEDSLDADRLVAMGLLCPGWEQDYEGRPPVGKVVCVGRVISHTRIADERYNILLLGLRRARILRELPPRRMFREACVELLDDVYPQESAGRRSRQRRRLMDRFRRIVPKDPAAQEQVEQLLGSQIPLGVLTDLVAYSLDIGLCEKRRMLEETNVDRRADALLEHLDRLLEVGSTAAAAPLFPPQFSVN